MAGVVSAVHLFQGPNRRGVEWKELSRVTLGCERYSIEGNAILKGVRIRKG